MQLLFVVETTKGNQSDWSYIKTFISNNFKVNGNKLSFICAGGKGNLTKQDKIINKKSKVYDDKTVVFICFDVDKSSVENTNKNKEIIKYAKNHKYETIWFSETIEDVFLGKIVSNENKKTESERFLKRNLDINSSSALNCDGICNYHHHSNIKTIIGMYLEELKK